MSKHKHHHHHHASVHVNANGGGGGGGDDGGDDDDDDGMSGASALASLGFHEYGPVGFDDGGRDVALEQLRRSQSRGLWGNAGVLNQLIANPLVWVDLPPWMSRMWTVTLIAMRYGGGPLSGTTYTPDQQSVPENFVNTAPLQLDVEYGTMNAGERCVIDYPWAGATFEVPAASIKISVRPYATSAATAAAIVGAFISPCARGGGQLKSPPTFTQFVQLTGGATTSVAVPARARSYSIACLNAASFAQGLTLTQQTTPTALQTNLRVDTLQAEVPGTAPSAYEFWSGGLVANYPLHPLCTSIQFVSAAAFTVQYQIRFELDIG